MVTPAEIAVNYVEIGKNKAAAPGLRLVLLGIMAGAFIGLAAAGANTAVSLTADPAAARLLSALLFPAGLSMVLFAGAELFTGNNLMSIALLEREIRLGAMLRCWALVYIGNFLGALAVAGLVNLGGQLDLFDGRLAVYTIRIAVTKTGLTFGHAVILGILCNVLVCLAVWMGNAGKTVTDKLLAIYFPILMFVLSGFEHSVANMYYISAGLFAAANPDYAQAAQAAGVELGGLGWGSFLLKNLLPVTLGNIIGGAGIVGGMYWAIYVRGRKEK